MITEDTNAIHVKPWLDKYRLPISELFLSPQGEGRWVGTMMFFIRTAGCTVGKPIKEQTPTSGRAVSGTHKDTDHYGTIPIWQEECTLYDGRKFLCDTDFRVKERLTADEILHEIPTNVKHICITGGEPLNYNLERLIYQAQLRGITVHIETSGTIPLSKAFPNWEEYGCRKEADDIWVAVSPKKGVLDSMIMRANEIKLLVDQHFDIEQVPALIQNHPLVYLQPVNGVSDINRDNLKKCLEIMWWFPNFILSTQEHKNWGVR